VELTFECGDRLDDEHVDVPPFSDNGHLKLKIEQWVTTSFGLVIKKP
jgi:hypothetical protein